MGGDDELARLRVENARLVELLEAHGIAWRQPEAEQLAGVPLSTDEKVALFRRLFRGRSDVYPCAGKTRRARAAIRPWATGFRRMHDMRRTARTHMAALGVDRFVAERALNHKLRDVEGVYNQYDYFEERKDALVRWARLLEAIA